MAITLAVPSSPSNNSSPSSAVSEAASITPLTPPSATEGLPDNSNSTSSPVSGTSASGNPTKRKPSRRANTAERRATHNAVERQRRETLNGRFLDLAGLLPNLSQIRRPSKSAIVNSSIAHIQASRRHRMIAARELRLLKLESDALRRELNEWRDRSALPRVEEPVRGDGFGLVLSGEVEVILPNNLDDDDVMEDEDEDCVNVNPAANAAAAAAGEDVEDLAQAAAVALLKANGPGPIPTSTSPPNPFAYNVPPLTTNSTTQPIPIVNANSNHHARSHSHSMSSVHSSSPATPGHHHPAIAQLLTTRQSHFPSSHPMIASHPYDTTPMGSYEGHYPPTPGYHSYAAAPGGFNPSQLPPHILAQLAAEMEGKAAAAAWYNNLGHFSPPSSSGSASPVGTPYGYPQSHMQRRYTTGEDMREAVGRERSSSMGSRASPVGYEMVGGRWMGEHGHGVSQEGTVSPGYPMML